MDQQFIPSLKLSLPKLGFGAMRLPLDAENNIDIKPSLQILERAYAAGVNFFVSAYIYSGSKNEGFLGEHFFSKLPRESFTVATKLPVFRIKEFAECQGYFDQQLANLRLDYIDFYLAHSINKDSWQKFKAIGGPQFLLDLKKQGKIKHIGFSFHGEPADLGQICDDFPWEFVYLQINYYDWPKEVQDAKLQYEEVVKRNLLLIVMEPVRGHALAKLPKQAEQVLRSANPDSSMARWAFRWVGSLPKVVSILSGMSTMEQLEENIATFSNFEPLSAAEQEAIDEARQILLSVPCVPCTYCDYCAEPCPQNIRISYAFEMYNDFLRLESDKILTNYGLFTKPEERANQCTKCGLCNQYCPQNIDIPVELAALQKEIDRVKADQK